jgi:hypothetical protein
MTVSRFVTAWVVTWCGRSSAPRHIDRAIRQDDVHGALIATGEHLPAPPALLAILLATGATPAAFLFVSVSQQHGPARAPGVDVEVIRQDSFRRLYASRFLDCLEDRRQYPQ